MARNISHEERLQLADGDDVGLARQDLFEKKVVYGLFGILTRVGQSGKTVVNSARVVFVGGGGASIPSECT
jgi:hypothetical protein